MREKIPHVRIVGPRDEKSTQLFHGVHGEPIPTLFHRSYPRSLWEEIMALFPVGRERDVIV